MLGCLQPAPRESGALWAAEVSPAGGQQIKASPEEPANQAVDVQDEVLAGIQSALESLKVPEVTAVAKALGVEQGPGKAASDVPAHSLKDLGDLDGDGIPELALKWLLPEPGEQDAQGLEKPRPSWGLFLLSWDGRRWRVSRLVIAAEAFQFQAINLGAPTGRGIAVITVDGETAISYPAVFQVKEHAAIQLWDGQADESRYQGYEHGQIEFRDADGRDPARMIVTGRADPGLLVFQKGGRRGFTARAVYRWDGQAFVPAEVEYSINPDYSLYRFISALHLHGFRAAYAVIDPAKFLKTDAPTLDMFRQVIQDSWPEFLDDQVFEAGESGATSTESYAFSLPEKHYVYHPTFSSDGRFLLTSLARQEESK